MSVNLIFHQVNYLITNLDKSEAELIVGSCRFPDLLLCFVPKKLT